MPDRDAGCRIDPPVSVPVAPGTSRAATAAAEPPELPPGTYSTFHALLTAPKYDVSLDEPIANSSMLVLPTSTVPARRSRSTTNASYGATKCSSIREPQVVRSPAVISTSLCAIGMPQSGPAAPSASAASAALAAASAPSASTVTKALSAGLCRAIRPSASCVSSTDDARFAWSARDSAAMVSVTPRPPRLFDHLGHEVEAVLDRRGDALVENVGVGFGDAILAQRQHHVLRVRHRHDARGVHRPEFVDQSEDGVELAPDVVGLCLVDLDPSEMSDAEDVG